MVDKHKQSNTPIISALQWQSIETVLLDMDGTLLDLCFDDTLWRQQLPIAYSEHHHTSFEQAQKIVNDISQKSFGQLDWYCIDFWSAQLGFDIRPSKQKLEHLIDFRPGAMAFLHWLKREKKHVILATNAHPDSIALKDARTDLGSWVDQILHAHDAGAAKESPEYWQWLHQQAPFSNQQSLFIDDNDHILDAAQKAGVAFCLGVKTPNSTRPAKTSRYPSFSHFQEIYPQAL